MPEPTTQPAAATPAAPPTPPAATETAAPASKVPTEEELRALKAEALKHGREARELRERLKAAEAERSERLKSAEAAERARRELDELRERDPGAWLEKLTGEDRAKLAGRLKGGQATDPMARELAELKAKLAEREAAESERERQALARAQEAEETTAYRSVLQVAKGDDELELAAETMKENPRAAAKWIRNWAEKEWPDYAATNGLDALDPQECAKAAARVIATKELDRLNKLVQNPKVAKRLALPTQSQQPPASQGNQPPKTLTASMASERSTATAPDNRPVSKSERDAALRKKAELKALELLASRSKG